MTPTSATGARRGAQAGFTLVEVMVVLTIIGLLAGLAVLAMPDGRPSVWLEAERFGARLKRAQEEAVMTNRPVEVAVSGAGYGFRVRADGGWRPLIDGPFRQVAWEEGTATRQEAEGAAVAFDPTGAATPAAFTLSRGGRSVRVVVDPAGNVEVHGQAG